MQFLKYVSARFGEASSYAALAAMIPSIALLPEPWSWIAFALAAAGFFLPGGRSDAG